MAGIFDLVLAGARNDDILARIGSTAFEAACHLVPSDQGANDVAKTVGTIVSAAGFPEFGIPIAVGGYLLGRWLNSAPAAHHRS
jgi:hypothetical protein